LTVTVGEGVAVVVGARGAARAPGALTRVTPPG
jgi:hypothetical protein